jgi:hypothetical protein
LVTKTHPPRSHFAPASTEFPGWLVIQSNAFHGFRPGFHPQPLLFAFWGMLAPVSGAYPAAIPIGKSIQFASKTITVIEIATRPPFDRMTTNSLASVN